MFLRIKDFKPQIRTEVLSIVSNFNDSNLVDAEVLAISRMTGYLYVKFDTAKIFAPLVVWAKGEIYTKDQRIILTADAYVPATSYVADDLALQVGKVYICHTPTTGVFDASKWTLLGEDQSLFYVAAETTTAGTLVNDGVEFIAGDTRTPVIRQTVIDILLYILHGGLISRNQVPQIRIDNWNLALDWLRDMRDGQLQDPSIPVRLNSDGDTEGTFFKYGSQTQFNNGSW